MGRSGFGIVFVECIVVGIGDPEILAIPTDAVGAIADGRPPLLDDPRFGVNAVHHPGGRNGGPELAFPPLQAMGAGSRRAGALHLTHLESADALSLTAALPLGTRLARRR